MSNKSEVVNDLLRRARRREKSIEEIRAALVEAEQSGMTESSVDDIWAEARSSGADASLPAHQRSTGYLLGIACCGDKTFGVEQSNRGAIKGGT